MREPDLRLARNQSLASHPIQMRCQGLPNGFVILERPYLSAHELQIPNGYSVSSRSSATDVEEQAVDEQRVCCNLPYTTVCAGLREALGVISAFDHLHVIALPYVLVLVWALC